MTQPLFGTAALLASAFAPEIVDYRRRERRPMATAVAVRQGRYFDRLSNGTLVRAGSRR
jgi:hypothetical protein